MRRHKQVKVTDVKVGDVLLHTDNSKWKVSDVRLMPNSSSLYYILAQNGAKLERWQHLKADDKVRQVV